MWIVSVLNGLFQGMLECLSSAEGVLALLALAAVSFLCYRHCVGDVSFAAVCTMIPTIFAYCQHKIDLKQLEQQVKSEVISGLPPKGQ